MGKPEEKWFQTAEPVPCLIRSSFMKHEFNTMDCFISLFFSNESLRAQNMKLSSKKKKKRKRPKLPDSEKERKVVFIYSHTE